MSESTTSAAGSFGHRVDPMPSRLWFGLLAAPFAWTAQGALGWFFGGRICTSMSIPSVRLAIALVSLAAAALAAWGLLTAWRSWRQTGDRGTFEARDRVAFMSMAGIFVSGSFLLGTLWAGLTPLLIDSCGGMR